MPCYYDESGEVYCVDEDENTPSWSGGLEGTSGDQPGDYPQFGYQSGEGGNYDVIYDANTPGYYDEITGRFVPDPLGGTTPGQAAGGPSAKWADWKYDPATQTWTDPQGIPRRYVPGASTPGTAPGAKKPGTSADKALKALTSNQGLAGILGAILGAASKSPAYGGGARQGYAGPKQMTRTLAQGKYGPIARYAANGGLMQAYAQGGPVQMEDGGFVMTKRAVDGAGGPQGIQRLVPGARMIRGPGTGTSDDIPAVINGRRGQTPALLSNGEAYVPKPVVDGQGGAQQMYALMNKLQRRG